MEDLSKVTILPEVTLILLKSQGFTVSDLATMDIVVLLGYPGMNEDNTSRAINQARLITNQLMAVDAGLPSALTIPPPPVSVVSPTEQERRQGAPDPHFLVTQDIVEISGAGLITSTPCAGCPGGRRISIIPGGPDIGPNMVPTPAYIRPIPPEEMSARVKRANGYG
jgi:hypothetical protein